MKIPPSSIAVIALLVANAALLPRACDKKIGEDDQPAQSATVTQTVPPPPTMPSFSAQPLSDFMPDGGDETVAQAHLYEARGQLWLARLMMEPRAFADDAKTEDVAFLAKICDEQDDDSCVVKCNQRLPKNQQLPVRKHDGGRAPAALSSSSRPDDNTDFAKAQKLLLGGKAKEARAILEPKMLDGRATNDEVRLLREACKAQNDRMCVVACNAKIK